MLFNFFITKFNCTVYTVAKYVKSSRAIFKRTFSSMVYFCFYVNKLINITTKIQNGSENNMLIDYYSEYILIHNNNSMFWIRNPQRSLSKECFIRFTSVTKRNNNLSNVSFHLFAYVQ